MDIKCPCCKGIELEEIKLDRYSDILYRKFVCCNCGCSFVAKYSFSEIINGSIRTEDKPIKSGKNENKTLSGEILKIMFRGK